MKELINDFKLFKQFLKESEFIKSFFISVLINSFLLSYCFYVVFIINNYKNILISTILVMFPPIITLIIYLFKNYKDKKIMEEL